MLKRKMTNINATVNDVEAMGRSRASGALVGFGDEDKGALAHGQQRVEAFFAPAASAASAALGMLKVHRGESASLDSIEDCDSDGGGLGADLHAGALPIRHRSVTDAGDPPRPANIVNLLDDSDEDGAAACVVVEPHESARLAASSEPQVGSSARQGVSRDDAGGCRPQAVVIDLLDSDSDDVTT